MKTFSYYYDGATPAAPSTKSLLGVTSAVAGDGYTKLFEYRRDGLLSKRTITLGGWRTLETTLSYLEGGVLGSRTLKLSTADGALLSTSTQVYVYGDYGRLESVSQNGSTLVSYSY